MRNLNPVFNTQTTNFIPRSIWSFQSDDVFDVRSPPLPLLDIRVILCSIAATICAADVDCVAAAVAAAAADVAAIADAGGPI